MKNSITINSATYGSAWNDFINVHNNVRIPSPRLSNFTKRITRNSRKNSVMEIFYGRKEIELKSIVSEM